MAETGPVPRPAGASPASRTCSGIPPGQVAEVGLAGVGGLPSSGLTDVVVNVTAVSPSSPGNLVVYDCATTRPAAASLNFAPGPAAANLVMSRVSDAGSVCVVASSTTHVVVDVQGYRTAG